MKRLLATLTLIFTASTAGATETAPSVALRAEARTPGTRILLEDVVEKNDIGLLDETLLKTDLCRSPSPGFGRVLSRGAILAALPEHSVRLTGPAEIRVYTQVVQVAGEKLLEQAREFLAGNLGIAEGSLIEVTRQPSQATVPRGREGIELVPRFRGKPMPRGNVAVQVELRVDGVLQQVATCNFLVRTFTQIPVLARDVARGQTLEAEHVKMVRTETTRAVSVDSPTFKDLFGTVARRNLRADSPLRRNDFQPPVLVRRNDAVTLVFSSGTLRAEAFGIARDSGTLGTSIRVENLHSRRTLVGRVVGPGLVQMKP